MGEIGSHRIGGNNGDIGDRMHRIRIRDIGDIGEIGHRRDICEAGNRRNRRNRGNIVYRRIIGDIGDIRIIGDIGDIEVIEQVGNPRFFLQMDGQREVDQPRVALFLVFELVLELESIEFGGSTSLRVRFVITLFIKKKSVPKRRKHCTSAPQPRRTS